MCWPVLTVDCATEWTEELCVKNIVGPKKCEPMWLKPLLIGHIMCFSNDILVEQWGLASHQKKWTVLRLFELTNTVYGEVTVTYLYLSLSCLPINQAFARVRPTISFTNDLQNCITAIIANMPSFSTNTVTFLFLSPLALCSLRSLCHDCVL